MGAPRLYLRYVGIALRSQLQYRASFVMLSVGQLLLTGIEFLAVWALFDRFGQLEGWSLAEVALLYGMANVAFAIAEGFGRGFDVFPRLVKSGDFDRLLLRPRGTAFQVAGSEVQLLRIGRLLQGLVVLVAALASLDGARSASSLSLVTLSILGGACTFTGLFVLQATLAFWTIEGLEIVNTVTYGGCETTQYPLTVYHTAIRRFFTFVVPLAFLNSIPAQAILGRETLPGLPAWLPWLAPLVGPVFLLACLRVWRVGVRHYRSTGS